MKPQGQFIGESAESSAFEDRYCGDEFRDCGANAEPLRWYAKYLKNLFCLGEG
jgi:hypothetical protein